MIYEGVTAVREMLRQQNYFGESIIRRVEFVNYGFTLLLEFELVVGPDGHLLELPRAAWIGLEGVEKLEMIGGINSSMINHPERLGEGLSEIALIELSNVAGLVDFNCLWEGARKIRVCSSRIVASDSLEELSTNVVMGRSHICVCRSE